MTVRIREKIRLDLSNIEINICHKDKPIKEAHCPYICTEYKSEQNSFHNHFMRLLELGIPIYHGSLRTYRQGDTCNSYLAWNLQVRALVWAAPDYEYIDSAAIGRFETFRDIVATKTLKLRYEKFRTLQNFLTNE